MTCEEFLDAQEAYTRATIAETTRLTSAELKTVVDLPDLVRRRPALTLGVGAAAGFFAGSLLHSNTRRVTRGAIRSAWSPLLRPTFTALGAALAEILVGSTVSPPE